MKLPVVDDMERVMEATTMPTLLLGGDSGVDPDETFAAWEDALALPGVRGLTVGPHPPLSPRRRRRRRGRHGSRAGARQSRRRPLTTHSRRIDP